MFPFGMLSKPSQKIPLPTSPQQPSEKKQKQKHPPCCQKDRVSVAPPQKRRERHHLGFTKFHPDPWTHGKMVYIGSTPQPMAVITGHRDFSFFVGNPYKPVVCKCFWVKGRSNIYIIIQTHPCFWGSMCEFLKLSNMSSTKTIKSWPYSNTDSFLALWSNASW